MINLISLLFISLGLFWLIIAYHFLIKAVYCVSTLGLDKSKVNPRGGAMYVTLPRPKKFISIFFISTPDKLT